MAKQQEDEKANKITFRNTPDFRKVFVEQCLAQATEHGFAGNSLKTTSWDSLCKFFSDKYDCTMSQKKLKNHWDYLRTTYVIWSRLLARTGHGYSADTNTFDLSDEEWVQVEKAIKGAKQFKQKGLEDADLLGSLFDGKFAVGANRDTPGRTELSIPSEGGIFTTAAVSNNESESRTSCGKEQQAFMDDNEVDSDPNARGSGKKRKKTDAVDDASSDLLTEKVCSVVTSMETHLQQKKLALEKNDAGEFIATLENLLETGYITMEDYLDISLKASETPGWQKLFVSLKIDERRVTFANKLLGKL